MTAHSSHHDECLPVVHAVPGAWLPRTETWLYDQVRFLPTSVEPDVVCDRTEHLDQFGLPRIHAVDADPPALRRVDALLRRARLRRHRGLLARVLSTTGAPVLHSHFGPEGCRNDGLAARRGIAHVVTFYGYDVNCLPRQPRWRRRYERLFDRAAAVLCEGAHMANCLRDLGCPERALRVHHLGVDLAKIPFRPRSWNGREPLCVLLAAAFREKKGLPLAIDALGRLGRDVDLRITIIGDTTSAPDSAAEKERLLAAVERHRLGGRVAWLGFQPHAVLTREAQAHHLYVAPSLTATDGDTEGGAPVTLIEMAAAGVPIVSTRHCDIPGIVRHGETGFLAREGDADDLRAQIDIALDHAAGWPAMLAAGRRHVEAHFDARVQGDRLAGVYRALAAGAPLPESPSSTTEAPAGDRRCLAPSPPNLAATA